MNLKLNPFGRSTFRNWSGEVTFRPSVIRYPESEAEIAQILRNASAEQKVVRVVGTAHSFTPLMATDGVLISLDRLQGVIEDGATVASQPPPTGEPSLVTVWGGDEAARIR